MDGKIAKEEEEQNTLNKQLRLLTDQNYWYKSIATQYPLHSRLTPNPYTGRKYLPTNIFNKQVRLLRYISYIL